MIIGAKHVDTPKISTTYNITNVFKNADGSIDSYQVEIAQTNGETYKVFLNSKEMAAVSDNVVAAYEYIRRSAAGYYLFDVLMGGCDLEYAEKYFELTNAFTDPEQLEFYIRTINPVTIEQYCTLDYQFPIGFNVIPRFEIYDEYYGKYKDNVWGGNVSPINIRDIDNFDIGITGLIWIDGKTRDARNIMRNHEYVQLITKDDETYKQSLAKCRCLFEERLKTIKEKLKEKLTDGEK